MSRVPILYRDLNNDQQQQNAETHSFISEATSSPHKKNPKQRISKQFRWRKKEFEVSNDAPRNILKETSVLTSFASETQSGVQYYLTGYDTVTQRQRPEDLLGAQHLHHDSMLTTLESQQSMHNEMIFDLNKVEYADLDIASTAAVREDFFDELSRRQDEPQIPVPMKRMRRFNKLSKFKLKCELKLRSRRNKEAVVEKVQEMMEIKFRAQEEAKLQVQERIPHASETSTTLIDRGSVDQKEKIIIRRPRTT